MADQQTQIEEPVIPSILPDAENIRPLDENEEFIPLNQPGLTIIRPLGEGEEFTPIGKRTTGQKIKERFLGTDVDDELMASRAAMAGIGAFIGGQLGAQLKAPGPLGVVINPVTGMAVFGTAGAVVGALFPEAALETGEKLGLLEQGLSAKIGLTPEELLTVAEGEALLELSTLGGISVMRLSGRGFTSLFTGLTKQGRALAERAARIGIPLLPVQVGDRIIARGYVAVMGKFPFFAGPIRKAGKKTEAGAKAAINDQTSRIGVISAWNDISVQIMKDADELLKRMNKLFGDRYEAIFKRADELGITVAPSAVVTKAKEITGKLTAAANIGVKGKPLPLAKVDKKVVDFINKNVIPMSKESPGGTMLAKQTLTQMDGLVTKIDQFIATLKPGQKAVALKWMTQIRQAVQLDMKTNLRAVDAESAADIARRLTALDTTFSHAVSQLFETSTAKQFASVRKRGLRAIGFEEATRIPVDKLASVLVKMDSPMAIEQLSRIVSFETMQRIAATTIDDAFRGAVRTDLVDGIFDVKRFAAQLGLDNARSPRALSVKKLLEKSGHPMTFKDLENFVEIARKMESLEIPNVSAFIARRGTLGGVKAIVSGLAPGMALAGGSAAVGFTAGNLMGILTFLFGGRGISKAISNPLSARAFKEVMKEEVKAGGRTKKIAFLRVLRVTINALHEDEEITDKEKFDLERLSRFIMLEMNNAVEKSKELVEGLQSE